MALVVINSADAVRSTEQLDLSIWKAFNSSLRRKMLRGHRVCVDIDKTSLRGVHFELHEWN
jgi:hypothetical protein